MFICTALEELIYVFVCVCLCVCMSHTSHSHIHTCVCAFVCVCVCVCVCLRVFLTHPHKWPCYDASLRCLRMLTLARLWPSEPGSLELHGRLLWMNNCDWNFNVASEAKPSAAMNNLAQHRHKSNLLLHRSMPKEGVHGSQIIQSSC